MLVIIIGNYPFSVYTWFLTKVTFPVPVILYEDVLSYKMGISETLASTFPASSLHNLMEVCKASAGNVQVIVILSDELINLPERAARQLL